MKSVLSWITMAVFAVFFLVPAHTQAWFGSKYTKLTPDKGLLFIPVKDVSDGKAHYFSARSEKGIDVKFFVIKSGDGVIRAAIDACDVCYRSGKGYVQEKDVMVCTNCGMRFATNRINEIKGGCNPAPLKRSVQDDNLVIAMADINENAWYCEFTK